MGESSWNGYEHNCLFANAGDGQFADVARPTGTDGVRDGRGVAVADFDGDGRLDLAVNNNNAPPTLYLNRSRSNANWLRFVLKGTASNGDAVGARLRLLLADRTLYRRVEAGSGYASQSSFAVHFGLGDATSAEAVEITWPSGRVEHLDASSWGVNRIIHLEEKME